MKKIITIGRQCGSGGHTIGKMVAERLGIPFYDKEIIQKVAKESGLLEETIEREGEYSTTSFLFNLVTHGVSGYNVADSESMLLRDQINAYQTNYIKELAEQGPCVIIGRSADYILEDRDDCVHVFIYGDLEDRMKRVEQEHGISSKDSKAHVMNRDKKRSKYYKYVTDKVWGLAENYTVCLNSSELGIERCVDIIVNCYK